MTSPTRPSSDSHGSVPPGAHQESPSPVRSRIVWNRGSPRIGSSRRCTLTQWSDVSISPVQNSAPHACSPIPGHGASTRPSVAFPSYQLSASP
jgi:hypothetical protein